MDALLLTILILVGDPAAQPLAQAVADDLGRRGGQQVRVVVGDEALRQLDERGVKPKDLLVSPNIAAHLTAGQEGRPGTVIVLHIDRREAAGDVLVETRAWLDGRSDRHVAIAGKGGDPTGAVTGGIQALIGHRLPAGVAPAAAGAPDDVQLAQLAERRQWTALLGRLAGAGERTPRQAYYEILAYVRLGQRDAAVEALNRLRTRSPDHFLVPAAAELIPPVEGTAAGAAGAAGDDGSNTLRDAPVEDDGSNTLR